MIVVGITGGSGSGKSLFCQYLSELCEAPLLDADKIYHELTDAPTACTAAIAEAFGDEILQVNGALCRPALAAQVFGKDGRAKERLALLNEITHRFVREEFERRLSWLEKKETSVVLLDVPLLFESGFDALCRYTVSVLADRSTRLHRIMSRDGISADAATGRLEAQPHEDFYVQRSDAVVYNCADAATLIKEAKQIAERFGLLNS